VSIGPLVTDVILGVTSGGGLAAYIKSRVDLKKADTNGFVQLNNMTLKNAQEINADLADARKQMREQAEQMREQATQMRQQSKELDAAVKETRQLRSDLADARDELADAREALDDLNARMLSTTAKVEAYELKYGPLGEG
jgi:predicted  nucleic acid-binding Zn-ribbon protein